MSSETQSAADNSAGTTEGLESVPGRSVSIATVVFTLDDRVLLIFNPRWNSYTFPMTKLRSWHDPLVQSACREEHAVDAAARVVLEVMETRPFELRRFRSHGSPGTPLETLSDWYQGDRDGLLKRYTIHVYAFPLESEEHMLDSNKPVFLSPGEVVKLKGISHTAVHIMKSLKGGKLNESW